MLYLADFCSVNKYIFKLITNYELKYPINDSLLVIVPVKCFQNFAPEGSIVFIRWIIAGVSTFVRAVVCRGVKGTENLNIGYVSK